MNRPMRAQPCRTSTIAEMDVLAQWAETVLGCFCYSDSVVIIIFSGCCQYSCSGLDMLNHKHYINFNIKAMNVCSAQFSILHVSRDIIDLTLLRRWIND